MRTSETKVPKEGPRGARSMLGPILLIAAGVFLLLSNTGYLPQLNWDTALRLWPLLLIMIGLDIMVRFLPKPIGTFFSILIALTAFSVFSFALLYSGTAIKIGGVNLWRSDVLQRKSISIPANSIQQAAILIRFDTWGGEIEALSGGSNLLEADISYQGELVFEQTVVDGSASVNLETIEAGIFSTRLNLFHRFDSAKIEPWYVKLSPKVPTFIKVDLSSGTSNLSLDDIELLGLEVNGGLGYSEIKLGDGDYHTTLDVGDSAIDLQLASQGCQDILIDGGRGDLTIYIPASIAVTIIADRGSGDFKVTDDRFTQESSAARSDELIWNSARIDSASNRVYIRVDAGSGTVTITELK